jgi:prevent-host-death family protein
MRIEPGRQVMANRLAFGYHSDGPTEKGTAQMSIRLTEDFKTAEEMNKDPQKIFDQVHQTGRPVVVTVNGKPDVVILAAETYEKHLRTMSLAHLLAEAEADVRAGRVRPAEEFFAEMEHAKKIPGRARNKSRK